MTVAAQTWEGVNQRCLVRINEYTHICACEAPHVHAQLWFWTWTAPRPPGGGLDLLST